MKKKILIISPHYPPSNLAAVHRTRLFAQHLPSYGWNPIILTVHEKFYEEKLDYELEKLLPIGQRIVKVNAFPVTKPRLLGDIGLRAFFQLRRKALNLIRKEKIDFVLIPIPSFYAALIGPYLFKKTGVKYGIDYIDPWVHFFPGSEKSFSRHWFSTQLAKILEPIAVKYASLITGVSEGYFTPVLERNPHLKKQAIAAAMPYGGEARDHDFIRQGKSSNKKSISIIPPKSDGIFRFVYAGAMLPKAYKPLEEIFKALKSLQHFQLPQPFQRLEFYFIGTLGTIKPFADKYNLWNTVVFEHPERIAYLEVLKNLDAADGVFILGSTEPHYTPSKLYQGVLSKRPLFGVLHHQSSAVQIIEESKAGFTVQLYGEEKIDELGIQFVSKLNDFLEWVKTYNSSSVNEVVFEHYSASSTTQKLINAISKIKE